MERGIIPADALMMLPRHGRPIGAVSYYLPDLKVLDRWGLTDATIARAPVLRPNSRRRMAHDRRTPLGYAAERGVNFSAFPPAPSAEEALERAVYAARVGPGLWMPFNAFDFAWVERRFEEFAYDEEADARFEEALKGARLLFRARFDVWLDGDRLLFVRDRCRPSVASERVHLHVTPANLDDLRASRRKHGFDNLDFSEPEARLLGTTRRCVASRTLPDYPVSAVRVRFRDHGGAPLRERSFFFDPPLRPPKRTMVGPR